MSNTRDLCSLPSLALQHLASFLDVRDLARLSTTCRQLRAALNSDIIWRRFTDQGCKALADIPCRVQPEFQIPTDGDLEPLCESRVHLLRKGRLLHNIHQGKFNHSTIELRKSTLNIPFNVKGPHRQETLIYLNKYFIIFEVYDGENEMLHLFNIETEPFFISSCFLPPSNNSFGRQDCKLVGNKLVIKRPDVVDVYRIILTEFSCPHLHSIPVTLNHFPTASVISNYVFIPNTNTNVVHVWDVHTGTPVRDILPPENFPCLYIVHTTHPEYPTTRGPMFPIGWSPYDIFEGKIPVYGFDIDLMDFSSFKTIWVGDKTMCDVRTDGRYVVFIGEKRIGGEEYRYIYYIYVHSYETSNLLAEKTSDSFEINSASNIQIINDWLLIPFVQRIQVLDLNTLEIIWELPDKDWNDFDYCNILDQCHLFVLKKMSVSNRNEVWDLEKKRRLFYLPFAERYHFYSQVSNTKLIIPLRPLAREIEHCCWHLLNFW